MAKTSKERLEQIEMNLGKSAAKCLSIELLFEDIKELYEFDTFMLRHFGDYFDEHTDADLVETAKKFLLNYKAIKDK